MLSRRKFLAVIAGLVGCRGHVGMVSDMTLSLADFAAFRKESGSPYPSNLVVLYSPVDDVHGALKHLIGSVQTSLVLSMYGFDDQELADIIEGYCKNAAIKVQLTFDASQATGAHEKLILNKETYPNTDVAVGNSEKGAIMHLKGAVVDGWASLHGSTNWSMSGETLQDNEMIVCSDPGVAVDLTKRIGAVHAHMLLQPQPHNKAALEAMAASAPSSIL